MLVPRAKTQSRVYQKHPFDNEMLQATSGAMLDFMPPSAYPHAPATSFATKFVHVSTNKIRTPVKVVTFMPDGRRLLSCSQNGEFTLWNGMSFNFETILQAHDCAIQAACWSKNENWLLTGDDAGRIKYWQTNLNNLKSVNAHTEPVRGLSFAPTDLKFCSCSDDTTVRVFDFARAAPVHTMSGHGGDVKCVDWHPHKGLLASGGKDSLTILWDAREGKKCADIHAHKNQVTCLKWNANGNWLATGCKDQTIKVFDIRTMNEIENFRGHTRDVTSVVWHPQHETLLTSGGYDGSIMYWIVGRGSEDPAAQVKGGHEAAVWSMTWHPAGHILCSGSNDNTTKFWCRNRPGEVPRDTTVSTRGAYLEAEREPPTIAPRRKPPKSGWVLQKETGKVVFRKEEQGISGDEIQAPDPENLSGVLPADRVLALLGDATYLHLTQQQLLAVMSLRAEALPTQEQLDYAEETKRRSSQPAALPSAGPRGLLRKQGTVATLIPESITTARTVPPGDALHNMLGV